MHLLGGGPVAVLSNWEPYALAVFAIAGLVVMQSAFQAGALQASLPFLETTEPLVASLLGIALLGERLHAATLTDKGIVAVSAATMLVCRGQPGPVARRARAGRRGPGRCSCES